MKNSFCGAGDCGAGIHACDLPPSDCGAGVHACDLPPSDCGAGVHACELPASDCGAGVHACDLPTSEIGVGVHACHLAATTPTNLIANSSPPFRTFYRRRLPHLRNEDSTYFVTWRVHPAANELSDKEREIVGRSLRFFDHARYSLLAFVVMNDHVHVILHCNRAFQLHQIVQSWKSYTAHQINHYRTKTGSIWQDEYFDRIIRDHDDLAEKVAYIEGNPRRRWPGIGGYEWVYAIADDYLG